MTGVEYGPDGRRSFAPGHSLTTSHGAWSPRRVDPVAASLVVQATEAVPFLTAASFGPALWAWARAEARCQLLAEYLDEEGLLDAEGRPRPALEAATRLEKLALQHRQRLGLDPAARANLEATLVGAKAGMVALDEAISRGAGTLRDRADVQELHGTPWAPSGSDAGVAEGPVTVVAHVVTGRTDP